MNSTRRTLLFMLIIMSVLSGNSFAEEWVNFGETKVGLVYYDKSSVLRIQNIIVTVSMKQILTGESAKAFAKEYPETAGVSYYIMYDKVICGEKMYKVDKSIFFNNNGNVLHDTSKDSRAFRHIGFRPIPTDTPIAWLAGIVCQ
jgi:hypothetical protein